MHVQIALLKWKAELTQAEIDEVLAQYLQFKEIDGVLDVTVAENTSPWNRGYTTVIFFRIRDEEARARLKADPRRQALAKQVDEMEEHGIGIVFDAPAVKGGEL